MGATIRREIEQLSRAPYLVQDPEALIGVRDELQRIREGRGSDHELEDDDGTWAIVDNAWRLAAKLIEARQELAERESAELNLFTVHGRTAYRGFTEIQVTRAAQRNVQASMLCAARVLSTHARLAGLRIRD